MGKNAKSCRFFSSPVILKQLSFVLVLLGFFLYRGMRDPSACKKQVCCLGRTLIQNQQQKRYLKY